jgi:hypothetical protein
MKLPRVVYAMGFVGLVPCLLGPLWWTLAPASVPLWFDHIWIMYGGLIAAFMCGTFWGFALPAIQGTAGLVGLLIASLLLLATWISLMLPFKAALGGLTTVFLLLLLADLWRERTLDTIPGYLLLRATLTGGTILAMVWRVLLPGPV